MFHVFRRLINFLPCLHFVEIQPSRSNIVVRVTPEISSTASSCSIPTMEKSTDLAQVKIPSMTSKQSLSSNYSSTSGSIFMPSMGKSINLAEIQIPTPSDTGAVFEFLNSTERSSVLTPSMASMENSINLANVAIPTPSDVGAVFEFLDSQEKSLTANSNSAIESGAKVALLENSGNTLASSNPSDAITDYDVTSVNSCSNSM